MNGSTFYADSLIVGFDPRKLQAMGVYGFKEADRCVEWKSENRKASTRWNLRKENEEDELNQWTRVTGLWDTEKAEKKTVDVVNLWAKKMCWDMSKGAPLVSKDCGLLRRCKIVIPAAPGNAVGVWSLISLLLLLERYNATFFLQCFINICYPEEIRIYSLAPWLIGN